MKKFDLHIDKFGVGLMVKDGQFYIRHKDSNQTIPPDKIKDIVLSKSTTISGAAVRLALDNDIDISFVDSSGMPFARVWNSRFGSITTIRRNQLSFSVSKDGSLWIKDVIGHKIKNQMALISKLSHNTINDSPFIAQFREKLSKFLLKISGDNSDDTIALANSLRGWEAGASKLFFKAINQFLPVPFKFTERSKHPALDPFNAALNYCYGIMYNKIEGMMIRAGLDPHIGVFHVDQYNRPVLVYDVIEIFRHWAEYPVIEAFRSNILLHEHFDIQAEKVFINPTGKKILIELYFSYLNEIVKWEDERYSRINHIKNYVENFATIMKNYKPNDSKPSGI